ncbi:hypothetical protein B0H12DRAFT_1074016 [Mycena haematopus]|nr:hypothetical protein B0H12DRAFT_1074016 [Mycena haematopus]
MSTMPALSTATLPEGVELDGLIRCLQTMHRNGVRTDVGSRHADLTHAILAAFANQKPAEAYWVVLSGREPGLYTLFEEANVQTAHVPNQHQQRVVGFQVALALYTVHYPQDTKKWVEVPTTNTHYGLPINSGAATSSNTTEAGSETLVAAMASTGVHGSGGSSGGGSDTAALLAAAMLAYDTTVRARVRAGTPREALHRLTRRVGRLPVRHRQRQRKNDMSSTVAAPGEIELDEQTKLLEEQKETLLKERDFWRAMAQEHRELLILNGIEVDLEWGLGMGGQPVRRIEPVRFGIACFNGRLRMAAEAAPPDLGAQPKRPHLSPLLLLQRRRNDCAFVGHRLGLTLAVVIQSLVVVVVINLAVIQYHYLVVVVPDREENRLMEMHARGQARILRASVSVSVEKITCGSRVLRDEHVAYNEPHMLGQGHPALEHGIRPYVAVEFLNLLRETVSRSTRIQARTKQTTSRPTPRARDPNMKRQLAVMTTANTQARDRAEKAAKANAKAKAATGHAKALVPLAATAASHSDSDGIEIVNTEARNVALATPEADLVVLSSASGSSASPATKRCVKYLKRYDLLLPPVTELDHAERASAAEEECMSPTIHLMGLPKLSATQDPAVLRVPQESFPHHGMTKHCIKEWHEKEDAAFQKLVQCPQCKEGAKPVHLAWATPTAAELAAKKAKKKVAHRAKGKEKRATLAREVRAKEKAVQKAKAKATQVAATTAALAPATAALAGMAAGPFMTDTATGSGDTATGSGHYVAPGLLLQAGVLYYRK